jgi:hypothetical protein
MTTWAVLATGPSMSVELARSVMHKCAVVVVSDAYKLAPWADAMVSADRAWWVANPEAHKMLCPKYCGFTIDTPPGVKKLDDAISGSNSGLLGIKVAISKGAKRVLLLGFDMGGSHYFGPHQPPLKNTKPERFNIFIEQFRRYRPKDVSIINCTPGSKLDAYPMKALDACLP